MLKKDKLRHSCRVLLPRSNLSRPNNYDQRPPKKQKKDTGGIPTKVSVQCDNTVKEKQEWISIDVQNDSKTEDSVKDSDMDLPVESNFDNPVDYSVFRNNDENTNVVNLQNCEIDTSPRSSSPIPEGHFEVEAIKDFYKDDDDELYLIKWKGWEDSHNTWEPVENLQNCKQVLSKFYLERRNRYQSRRSQNGITNFAVPPDPRPFFDRIDEFLEVESLTITQQDIMELLYHKKDMKKLLAHDRKRLERNLTSYSLKKVSKRKIDEMYYQSIRMKTLQAIEKNMEDLKEWEKYLNRVSEGRPKIYVENDVDLEGPPKNFTYINDYITGEGVQMPNEPPVGCLCTDCVSNKKKCCPQTFGTNFAYSRTGKLKKSFKGTPVYECNKRCKCDSTCPNRVVQDGRNCLKFIIFRTSSGCGWGVKTCRVIKKGTFVTLYLGEILNSEEAEKRGRIYDLQGATYLFDLDFNGPDNGFTVDAKDYGNVSHFINHSCDPNLFVQAVWVDCLDPELPKLALFAARNIAKGEELFFDYMNGSYSPTSTGPSNLARKLECLCKSDKCRKFLFC